MQKSFKKSGVEKNHVQHVFKNIWKLDEPEVKLVSDISSSFCEFYAENTFQIKALRCIHPPVHSAHPNQGITHF